MSFQRAERREEAVKPVAPELYEVLTLLERDARTTPEEIALQIGRPEEEVRAAIAHFEETGVIRTYKTVVDWERAGDERVLAFVDVRVTPARNVGFDDVAERVFRFPEVRSVYLVSGDYDLRVVVEGHNIKDVAFFVSDKLASLDRVLATATHFLLKKYKEDGVPFVDREADTRLDITP